MINTKNLDLARKEIRNSKESPIIIRAQDDVFNRKILEYGKFDILLSPESGLRRDALKKIDSGLNHILAKIATKNKIAIGIDIKEIKNLDKIEKAKRLGRLRTILSICRKAKTKIKVMNYSNKKDAFHFLLSIGASTNQAIQAF